MNIDKTLINKKGFSSGCSAYKNGICEDTNETCDFCYNNSMKIFQAKEKNKEMCCNCNYFIQHGVMSFDGAIEICSNKNSENYMKELSFNFYCKSFKNK